jgi:hypothetical protein
MIRQTGINAFEADKAIPASKLLEYYNLTEMQLKLYHTLVAGYRDFELVIRLPTPLKTDAEKEALAKAMEVARNLHPELFWLGRKWKGGNYTDGTSFFLPEYFIDGESFTATVTGGKFYAPPAEAMTKAKNWIAEVKATISKILDDVPVQHGMTPIELEIAVHDWMSNTIKCDEQAPNRDNIFGALVEQKAACEGFSQAFQYMMNRMGIECMLMSGRTKQRVVNHGWNVIKLDGQWYNVDVTRNAVSVTPPLVSRRYFNLTDADLSLTHERDDKLRVNPDIVCTATKYDLKDTLINY